MEWVRKDSTINFLQRVSPTHGLILVVQVGLIQPTRRFSGGEEESPCQDSNPA